MKLRASLWKALVFISTHPGRRRPACFTHRYYFNEPTLRRAPFRLQTVQELIALGLLEILPLKDSKWREELVQISAKGRELLNEIHPVDKLGRRKRLAKNWC